MILLKNCLKTAVVASILAASLAIANVSSAVNVNQADASALAATINGVGPRLAEAIVKHREQFGPFRSIEDLMRVKGIGQRLIERNRDRLEFDHDSNHVGGETVPAGSGEQPAPNG